MSKFESLDSLDKEQYLIRCPVCGQEYLAAELFLPTDLLGKPTDIVKRNDGKLDFYMGEKPSYTTEYCCDNCNTNFRVRARIYYDVTTNDYDNFDKDYTSKLKTNILSGEVDLFNNDN